MNWLNGLKGKIILNEPLSRRTTFKIGSPAKAWIEPSDLGDLKNLLQKIRARKKKYLVVGHGSNLLVKSKNISIVMHLGAAYFKKISVKGREVTVGAGLSLAQLVRLTASQGLGGIEFLSGIPGTVGGSLLMNAGVGHPQRMAIGDLTSEVEVFDSEGEQRILKRKDLKFDYRRSNLSGFIITGAKLKLEKKTLAQINKDLKIFSDYRRRSQDLSKPSAGCIFKNPTGDSAGRLIDLCGLKGARVGGAIVSGQHANFILNFAGATAEDVLKLIKFIQNQVKKKFNLTLETEIRIV